MFYCSTPLVPLGGRRRLHLSVFRIPPSLFRWCCGLSVPSGTPSSIGFFPLIIHSGVGHWREERLPQTSSSFLHRRTFHTCRHYQGTSDVQDKTVTPSTVLHCFFFFGFFCTRYTVEPCQPVAAPSFRDPRVVHAITYRYLLWYHKGGRAKFIQVITPPLFCVVRVLFFYVFCAFVVILLSFKRHFFP